MRLAPAASVSSLLGLMRYPKNWFTDVLTIGFAVIAAFLLTHSSVFANEFLDSLEFRHGIAFYQELKYPADFQHFDYVNPDAPKGGRWVESTQINFNSLAPSGDFGTQAPRAFWYTHDRLIERAGDEASAFYGRLADGIAVTPDRRTLVFRIHSKARCGVLLWEYFQLPLDVVARPRTVYWDKFSRPDFEPKYWPPFPDGWWYDPEKAARIDLSN